MIVLGYVDLDLGQALVNWDMNFWPKFFICFGGFLGFYLIIRTCINYFNGGLRRAIFFPVSFGVLLIGIPTFVLLYYFGVIDNSKFNIWSLTFLGYFAGIELFALIATFVRTFVDGQYYCPICDRFRVEQMLFENAYRQDFSVNKTGSKIHSYQKYKDTTVTTEVTATGRYGGQVDLDVKTSTKDNYETAYYTTSKEVTKNYTATRGTVICRRCFGRKEYRSIDPKI